MSELPYAEACERNKEPILAVLRTVFDRPGTVLEIGSGTGQHAVHFAGELPWLSWQASDVAANLPGLRARIEQAALPNLPPPLELDVLGAWPALTIDGVFSANTAHIMAWPAVERMFAGIQRLLPPGGAFCLYGPFNYGGEYTSASNREFDRWLRARDPAMGIRDLEALEAQATGLELEADREMPANNRLLVWRRIAARMAARPTTAERAP